MSDLEGLANLLLDSGISKKSICKRLVHEIKTYKAHLPRAQADRLANAVLFEVKRTRCQASNSVVSRLLSYCKASVSMGDMGVGSRGEGDFFVHKLISQLASVGNGTVVLDAHALDDAGIVAYQDKLIVAAVDGTHSRLSSYPFIAGFHVARAALRDISVKGARPVALIDDMHLADDGDVGKLFDFVAGVSTVSELSGTPLISGSTLRVGGDMVLGDRMVSCVGAIGVIPENRRPKAIRNIRPGDAVVMTEGSGGGTIATAALYSGNPDVVLETQNLKFLDSCELLNSSRFENEIHAMTDVTNGGIRGDAHAICVQAAVGMEILEDQVLSLINGRVFRMLSKLHIDPLGISLDALLIFCRQQSAKNIIEKLDRIGVKSKIVGSVIAKPTKPFLIENGATKPLDVRFRESPYTRLKQIVGVKPNLPYEKMKAAVLHSFNESLAKRKYVLDLIRSKKRLS